MSAYDKIARLYDPWSRSVVEDVPSTLDEARRSGGPVLELAVGTGRIAVPIAASGIPVVGVDLSEGMLQVARERAQEIGAELDLRYGDMRDPPVEGTFPLVLVPFRSMLHMETDADRRAVLRAIKRHLAPDGRLIFDVFAPGGRRHRRHARQWIEREPGIWERADWNEQTRTLVLRVRDADGGERDVARVALDAGVAALLAEEGFEVTRSTAGSTARRGPAARTRSGSAVYRPELAAAATRRARSRRTRRRSATRRRAIGIHALDVTLDLGRQPFALRAEQERDAAGEVDLARAASRGALRAQPSFVWSPHKPTGRGGRARSSRRSRAAPSARSDRRSRPRGRSAAPKASAVRISVPTLPGSARCQSASVAGRSSQPGRSARR